MAVHFFTEELDFKPKKTKKTKDWLKEIIIRYEKKIGVLNYIFCTDEYLRQVNIEYLDHNYYTDIITFDNSEKETHIEGDIFVSIERVTDNAQQQNQSFEQELRRVLVHGVLHLIGYDDHTDTEKTQMRNLEDEALAIYDLMAD